MTYNKRHTESTIKLWLRLLMLSLILFIMCWGKVYAQTQQRGRLVIVKDPRIDTLIAHRYSKNKATGKTSRTGISSYGYRVLFFSGNNRKDAFNAQNKFQQLHPEMRTYISYSEPNFKVKGGDFRSRLEAQKLIQELKGIFRPMFILSERINLPKLEPTPTIP